MRISREGINWDKVKELDSLLLKKGKVIDIVNYEVWDDYFIMEFKYYSGVVKAYLDRWALKWRSLWCKGGVCVSDWGANIIWGVANYTEYVDDVTVDGDSDKIRASEYMDSRCAIVINDYVEKITRLIKVRIDMFKNSSSEKRNYWLGIFECKIEWVDGVGWQYWEEGWDEAKKGKYIVGYKVCDWLLTVASYIKRTWVKMSLILKTNQRRK